MPQGNERCRRIRPWNSCRKSRSSGRRAISLAGNVLCNHAFISPKLLNRRLFTVQTPLQVGLLIGLQRVRVFCGSISSAAARILARVSGPSHFVPLPAAWNRPHTTPRICSEQVATLLWLKKKRERLISDRQLRQFRSITSLAQQPREDQESG